LTLSSDEAAAAQAEGAGGGDGGGPVDRQRLDAMGNSGADHVVEMALLGDVERVAVIGAERQEGREALGDDRHQGVEILGDGAFAHQDMHALADLLHGFVRRRAFVLGADARRQVAVQVVAAQQRRVAIDVVAPEGVELGEAARILVDDAREIHEFGQTDDLRMVAEGQEFFDGQIGAGGFQMGGGHAGGELDADVHDRLLSRIEEEADALFAEHIGDLVRIADGGGDAIGEDAAVEFVRRDQRAFDVQVGIDEARDDDAAGDFNLGFADVVAAGADDAVAAEGDVGGNELAGDEVEEASALQDDVGRTAAGALVDQPFEAVAHHRSPNPLLRETLSL